MQGRRVKDAGESSLDNSYPRGDRGLAWWYRSRENPFQTAGRVYKGVPYHSDYSMSTRRIC